MIRLVYVSLATKPLEEKELLQLLGTCRSNNTEQGITGQMIYTEGTFMQVLEGPQAAVDATFARIKKDTRHHNITLIERVNIDERQFSEWSMGFKSLTREQMQDIEGFNYHLEDDVKGKAGPYANQLFVSELMKFVKNQYVSEMSREVLTLKRNDKSLMGYLNNMVRYIVMALAVLMAFVVLCGVVLIAIELYATLRDSPQTLLSISGITSTFASFLAVLIAIDIFINISLYVRQHVIAVRLVVATALMAVARKIIVLDFAGIEPIQVLAMAAIVAALGFSYYFLSRLKSDQVVEHD
ncbi:MAG: blue light sensor protein [Zetaproteobacteria bacterium CG12_big_fil_rev_8_21_14_0_65_55_1124]|nr:MAG: hypothetical protein AUJ58_07090 [Zetaproteobacteria bacterium CG1_02_55_237]PIS20285.1 MAG: blue light sensor protein [Zetaproteobacteria bacterium CG08_land_8_20_14_0_20_55_17]PIW43161.1 MAG: blue light sensor protein [Zetaproteobacteria bacterium CG12_big_fil_rev_8_21_14_0_65_55_1124]PIY52125.1 MAG: blue light sensor protein [Zetaproteobacteria bacterium CG_4_10_14_0_8_um_filter_55_43]PIZ38138.1 MAG: blue light sensor protein [Zetaproteobacteria bacterium CG_4_10_14_0_2_um_filter_55_